MTAPIPAVSKRNPTPLSYATRKRIARQIADTSGHGEVAFGNARVGRSGND